MAKLFRGPTRDGLFQTIDLGSGNSQHLIAMARKNPKRTYFGIDAKYTKSALRELHGPLPKNFKFAKTNAIQALKRLIERKIKTRHISIDIPGQLLLELDNIFKYAKEVLLPRGKIYLTTESIMDSWWTTPARKNGFSVRELPNLRYPKTQYQMSWKRSQIPIRVFEFTLK